MLDERQDVSDGWINIFVELLQCYTFLSNSQISLSLPVHSVGHKNLKYLEIRFFTSVID